MICNCIEIFRETTLEKQPLKEKGLTITDVELPTLWAFKGNGVDERLKFEAKLTIEGRKTPYKIDVAYGFCPFCGKPAEKKKEEVQS